MTFPRYVPFGWLVGWLVGCCLTSRYAIFQLYMCLLKQDVIVFLSNLNMFMLSMIWHSQLPLYQACDVTDPEYHMVCI